MLINIEKFAARTVSNYNLKQLSQFKKTCDFEPQQTFMKLENQMNHRQKFAFGAIITIFVAWFALFAVNGLAQRAKTVSSNTANTLRMSNGKFADMSNRKFPTPVPTPEPTSVVRGRIVYEDSGRAVRRTAISLLSAKSGNTKSGLTDDNGAFEIKKVPAGEYLISINAPGVISPFAYADFSKGPNSEESRESSLIDMARNADKVLVDGIGDADVFIRAKHGAAISGRVYYADGDPAIGVKIEILKKKDDKFAGIVTNLAGMSPYFGGIFGEKTDDRGMYRINGLPAGDYVVRVTETASHSAERENRNEEMLLFGVISGSFLTTYFPDVFDVKDAKVLTLALGQEASETNITLPQRNFYKVAGKIVNRGTKQPIKGAEISISLDDKVSSINNLMLGESQRIRTDESGAWNYKELPAGKYTISVNPPNQYGNENYDEDLMNSNISVKKSDKPKPPKYAPVKQEITITDKDLNDVEIEMSAGATISGTVTMEGKPFPSSGTITARNGSGETLSMSHFSSGDDKNEYTSRIFALDGLSNGKIFLDTSFNSVYGENGLVPDNTYIKSVTVDNKDYLAQGIDVDASTNIKNATIIVGTDGGKLKGKIRQKGGENKPATGARFVLVPTDNSKINVKNYRHFVTTDGNGDFETRGAPFEYYVIFLRDEDTYSSVNENWIRERSQSADKVTIKPNATETANLTLP